MALLAELAGCLWTIWCVVTVGGAGEAEDSIIWNTWKIATTLLKCGFRWQRRRCLRSDLGMIWIHVTGLPVLVVFFVAVVLVHRNILSSDRRKLLRSSKLGGSSQGKIRKGRSGGCCRRLPIGGARRFACITVLSLLHPGRTSRLSRRWLRRLLWWLFAFLLNFFLGPFFGFSLRAFSICPSFCNLSQRATFRVTVQLMLSEGDQHWVRPRH